MVAASTPEAAREGTKRHRPCRTRPSLTTPLPPVPSTLQDWRHAQPPHVTATAFDPAAHERRRVRIALALTTAMVVMYFGFLGLVAFDRPLLARQLRPGLSLGIVLGALVIVGSWLLTWVYVRWANRFDDPATMAHAASDAESR